MANEQTGVAGDSELCKVTEFLRTRRVDEQVIERFVEENMDAVAVSHASDNTLRGLGLKTGDILSLKAFIADSQHEISSVEHNDRETRKKKLVEQLRADKDKKKSNLTKRKAESFHTQGSKQKLKSKKVQIGWMHYNEQQQRYIIPVRMAKGGGTRNVDMSVHAKIETVLQSATYLYFPNGSSYFGKLEDMETCVGNYKGDSIFTLEDENGEVQQFSIEKYYEINKTTRARLYLMSRHKQNSSPSLSISHATDDLKIKEETDLHKDAIVIEDDEYSDNELFLPSFLDNDWLDISELSHDSLLGSSSERASLIAEQNDAFVQSQATDYAKTQQKNEETSRKAIETQQANQLRIERASRVPNEPTDTQEAVTVHVRHIDLGLQSRSFPSNGTVSSVYDWIGSLSARPEYFRLCEVPGQEISPSESVLSVNLCTLFMEQSDQPVPLSPSGEISFSGFGVVARPTNSVSVTTASSETNWNLELKEEQDSSPYTSLREKQSRSKHLLLPPNEDEHPVKRNNIMNDLLRLYRDGVVDTTKIAFFRFAGEDAGGDGVTCDVFSSFWDEFFSKCCEGSGQCVPLLTAQFSESDYEAIGKIITHMFLCFEIFPLRLSEALIQYSLCGSVSNECLLASFLNLLAVNDRHILQAGLVVTVERVLNSLTFDESCETDRRVARWLQKFVRDANEVMSRRLVQFCTSLPMLLPEKKIKVVFVDQPQNHLRPVGATCFKLLKLPRQYASFLQLKENLEFYLTNTQLWDMSE